MPDIFRLCDEGGLGDDLFMIGVAGQGTRWIGIYCAVGVASGRKLDCYFSCGL